ncbi:MAG: [Fe-Fe] hydrogenase large subunit C-terminal domain-containing protein [Desulfatibacillaceae bacterium]
MGWEGARLSETAAKQPYVHFDARLCTGSTNCVKSCPTAAVRVRGGKAVAEVERCVGCGECIRMCPNGAVRPVSSSSGDLTDGRMHVAVVSPVLYAQFAHAMPGDVVLGMSRMGFAHVLDQSCMLEMFQGAAESFVARNRITREAPWPLISPVCPVVVRLIALKFPGLLPHLLPIMRPMALTARSARGQLSRETGLPPRNIVLHHVTPCAAKMVPARSAFPHERELVDDAMGINEVYGELTRQLERIEKEGPAPFVPNRQTMAASGRGLAWGLSGGEIEGMDLERCLAVSGLRETITYLEKIDMGLFRDLEYMEFRTCPEGCVGGPLAAIDKYLAKCYAKRRIRTLGLGRRVRREQIHRLFDQGWFDSPLDENETGSLSSGMDTLSIADLQKIEDIMSILGGKDCGICGAPDCRTFAEDVVRGRADIDLCLLRRQGCRDKGPGTAGS